MGTTNGLEARGFAIMHKTKALAQARPDKAQAFNWSVSCKTPRKYCTFRDSSLSDTNLLSDLQKEAALKRTMPQPMLTNVSLEESYRGSADLENGLRRGKRQFETGHSHCTPVPPETRCHG